MIGAFFWYGERMKLHQAIVKNKGEIALAFFPNPWYLGRCNNEELVEKRDETQRAVIAAGIEGQFEARLP